MKILFTGASSFTGSWFVHQLHAAGHELTMTFRGEPHDYEGLRAERVIRTSKLGESLYGCAFGDKRFCQVAGRSTGWDLLCHHAADVTDYRSPAFDITAAVSLNSFNVRSVLQALDCPVLLTGSVFEPNEGAGSDGLPALSPYGLSKALTGQIFSYYVDIAGLPLGKFVIPNPFGPYEEPRFTSYLVRSWYNQKTPRVNNPAYVRDNVHVSLLARAYVAFSEQLRNSNCSMKLNPSGYIETQGAFADRFAGQMRKRLGLACAVDLAEKIEFMEPRVRINTDPLDAADLNWCESESWDAIAEFYERIFSR